MKRGNKRNPAGENEPGVQLMERPFFPSASVKWVSRVLQYVSGSLMVTSKDRQEVLGRVVLLSMIVLISSFFSQKETSSHGTLNFEPE